MSAPLAVDFETPVPSRHLVRTDGLTHEERKSDEAQRYQPYLPNRSCHGGS